MTGSCIFIASFRYSLLRCASIQISGYTRCTVTSLAKLFGFRPRNSAVRQGTMAFSPFNYPYIFYVLLALLDLVNEAIPLGPKRIVTASGSTRWLFKYLPFTALNHAVHREANLS